jgi:collagenase-like PrtC family protease
MKYIVGLPIKENTAFLNRLVKSKEDISEVYFSWEGIPNGRSTFGVKDSVTAFEIQKRQLEHLKLLSQNGLRLNLLLNANCYGKQSQSKKFFYGLGDLIDFLRRESNLVSLTTASPLIARFVKENFSSLDVRASVNMEIGSVEGLSYVQDLFDSFYVKRELNRNLSELLKLRKWCDDHGKQLYLLANSGCLNNCSAHVFHDNLVAHEAEISAMENGYQFEGICWSFLRDERNRGKWLERTNFIRPEDIALYEEITPAVKLATRVNASPVRVLDAYLNHCYRGSVMELLEPNHSGVFYPNYIENSNFDADFATHVMNCNKNCESCHFCAEVMKRACIKLADDTAIKL